MFGVSVASSVIQQLIDCFNVERFGQSTSDTLDLLAVLKQENSGDAIDAVNRCNCRIVICVELVEFDPSFVLWCDFIQYAVDYPAWSTPRSPKLNKDRQITLKNRDIPGRCSDRFSYAKTKLTN